MARAAVSIRALLPLAAGEICRTMRFDRAAYGAG